MSRGGPLPKGTLTARERHMIRMLAEGFSTNHVGAELGIKPSSVSMQLGRTAVRLGIPGATRVRLVVECVLRGLLVEPQHRHSDECQVHIPQACTCYAVPMTEVNTDPEKRTSWADGRFRRRDALLGRMHG